MRILILGAGKMGSFFTDILSFQHETAVFDVNPHQLRFVYNTYRFTTLEEIKDFEEYFSQVVAFTDDDGILAA